MHFGDYTFIFLLALVLFGPKKLPEIGRQLGKLLAEFRRASNEFKFQIQEELRNMEDEERRKKAAELEAARAASPAVEAPAAEAALPASTGPSILPPSTGSSVSTSKPFAVPGPAEDSGIIAAPPDGEAQADSPSGPNGSLPVATESQGALDYPPPVEQAEPIPGESQNGVPPAAQEAAIHHD